MMDIFIFNWVLEKKKFVLLYFFFSMKASNGADLIARFKTHYLKEPQRRWMALASFSPKLY